MTEHHIRRVPTALLIAVVVQTVGGLVWAGGAAARIATLEQRVGEQRLVAERLARGVSPALAREVLGYRDQKVERILLEIRLVEGLPVTALDAPGRSQIARLVADGLVELVAERLVLTLRGRLLADGIVRDLVD